MHRRRDPLAGAEGGPPPRDGPRDEQRRPGGGTRMQHRGNDGVSSLQPAGTLLQGCRNDQTSCLRFGAALWDLRTSASGGSTGLPGGCLLGESAPVVAAQPERAFPNSPPSPTKKSTPAGFTITDSRFAVTRGSATWRHD